MNIFIDILIVKSNPFPRFSATPLSPSWGDDISAENRHGLNQVVKEFAYQYYQNTKIIKSMNLQGMSYPHIIPFVSESIFGDF